ncbi:hypothetical protein [Saccharothrix yanglingensis]|uniref:Integral membrane protein n=1 Tax=Saccharothrix yanglingensis TaxID=659496 RepID=A0ABU0WW65_9PSEU|nr:hypothetical protein [Saccharothrix yanglingensis]MDQ2584109.1 hypothetical protein [Saccharothrix yanglingensis]
MKGLAVLGTVLISLLAPTVMVYGLVAFTPTSCPPATTCAAGQWAMVVSAGGSALVWAVAVVGTWAGARGRPRAWAPYVGMTFVCALLPLSGTIAG